MYSLDNKTCLVQIQVSLEQCSQSVAAHLFSGQESKSMIVDKEVSHLILFEQS